MSAPVALEAPPSRAPVGSVEGARVLLLQEGPGAASIREALAPLALTLFQTASVDKAMAALDQPEVTVALLDLKTLSQHGKHGLAPLRASWRARQISFIYLSEQPLSPEALHELYRQGGAADCLQGPVDLQLLRAKVSVFLELHARTQAAEQQRRDLEASTVLASSLEYQTTLEHLAKVLVPTYADWCAVDMAGSDGKLERLAVQHVDPEKLALARELEARYPPDPNAPTGTFQVFRTGKSEWVADIPPEVLEASARDPEHAQLIQRLGLRSYVCVPITLRGQTLGVLTLVMAESGRRYSSFDVPRMQDLANRAALFVDNAQLYERAQSHQRLLERRAAELTLNAEIGSTLTEMHTLRPMLQRCAEAIHRHLDAAFVRVWLVDEPKTTLVLEASAGQYTHLDGPHGRVPVGKFKIGRIAQTREPHLTNDVPHDPHVGDPAWAAREKMVAFAGYPLMLGDELLGVVALFSRSALSEETLEALRSVADMLATGVRRRRAEEELVQAALRLSASEAKFRAMGAAIPQQVWTATPEGGLDFVNQRTEAYFGLPAEQLHGNGWTAGVHPEDLAVAGPKWVHSLQTGEPYEVEFRLRNGRGEYRWHLALALCTRDAQGRIERWFGSNTDIHDRKRTEQELERSNRELDQFAYVASHDLKAPLRGIANLSQWIEEDLAAAMTPSAREQMELLRGRVHRMENLINGVLAYSRAGRMRSSIVAVDMGDLAKEVVELLAPPAGVTIEIAPQLPAVQSEKVPLQQVLQNLVQNAIKYARRPDVRVDISAQDLGPWVELTVKDNGPGIAPEHQEKIWGIFQTLDARDDVEGTGIGLSVVRKIVESRGGRAWVESKPGSGATFRFTWPKLQTRSEA